LRAVDHVNVAVNHERVAMRDMVERPINRVSNAVAANVAYGYHEIASLNRILVHRPAVGEARKSDLGDVRAGEPVFKKGTNRIAVSESLSEVTHIEMRIKSDEADIVQLRVEGENRRPRYRIIAADKQREGMCGRARCDCFPDQRRRFLDSQASDLDITAIGNPSFDLAAGFDVIAPDPP
jgi:hypothetical protein